MCLDVKPMVFLLISDWETNITRIRHAYILSSSITQTQRSGESKLWSARLKLAKSQNLTTPS